MKFLSLIIVLALVMLVVSSPLPKNENADDSKDVKAESKDESKDSKAESKADSKDESKDSKAESKADSKDSKGDSKTSSAAADGTGATVLKSQKYNDFQISDGVAGNAKEEAEALFKGIDQNNLAAVSDEDFKLIKAVHDVAEQAEVKAFNPAIESASDTDRDALQVGKIKNKVLKLVATTLQLETQKAKGKDVDAKLEKEKTKLAKNIATDVADKGKASKSVPFDGST